MRLPRLASIYTKKPPMMGKYILGRQQVVGCVQLHHPARGAKVEPPAFILPAICCPPAPLLPSPLDYLAPSITFTAAITYIVEVLLFVGI